MQDFVTQQAVYTYLTESLGVSKDRESSAVFVEKYDQRINRLRSHTEAVTADFLDALKSAGELTLRDYDIVIVIQAYCHGCGSQYAISSLLEDDDCDYSPKS